MNHDDKEKKSSVNHSIQTFKHLGNSEPRETTEQMWQILTFGISFTANKQQ